MEPHSISDGDKKFLRSLPTISVSAPGRKPDAAATELLRRIKRLQAARLISVRLDAENSIGGTIFADVTITEAGRQAIGRD